MQVKLTKQDVASYHRRFDGKKAVLDYPPLWVTIGITGNCTFKCEFCCSHCPESGKNKETSHQYKVPFNMPFGDFKKIVDMCRDADVPHLHICGTGEPFLHPQILEFIDYLAEVYPKNITLQTDFCRMLFEKKGFVEEIIKRKAHITQITTDIFPLAQHTRIKKGSDFSYLIDCMEKISLETEITFAAHLILAKNSYHGISELITTMSSRNIRYNLDIVNLLPLGFNDFTSINNVYMSSDSDIAQELERARQVAAALDVSVKIPDPWNKENLERKRCNMFWQKVQLMPSKKLLKNKWSGNAIPQQCNAVVRGDLFSLGNIFDYGSFMEFWNNDRYIEIRKKIMSGEIPDSECVNCYTGCHGGFEKLGWVQIVGNYLPEKIYKTLNGFVRNAKNLFST